MKTAEEILLSKGITEKTKYHNYPYLYQSVLEAMEEYAQQKIIEEEIDSAIQGITDLHPYKEMGNRDSYSQYNEGWSDACDVLGETIKKLLI